MAKSEQTTPAVNKRRAHGGEAAQALTRVFIRRRSNRDGFDVFAVQAHGAQLATCSVKVPAHGEKLADLDGAKTRNFASPVDAVFEMDELCEAHRRKRYREYRFEYDDEDLVEPVWQEGSAALSAALKAALRATEAARQDIRARLRGYTGTLADGADWRSKARAIMAAFEGHLPISRLATKLLPTVVFDVARSDALPIGGTRFGGLPDMPADAAWPVRPSSGKPLSFVAQLSLAEVPRDVLAFLPQNGTLVFFYDVENKPDWRLEEHPDGSRVLYFAPGTDLVRREAPQELQRESHLGDALISDTASIATMTVAGSLPQDLDELGFEVDRALYLKLTTELCGFNSRLGGWPHLLQSEAGEPWEGSSLLLQVASSHGHDWDWFDAGYLYFWSHESDLHARDFDSVRVAIRC